MGQPQFTTAAISNNTATTTAIAAVTGKAILVWKLQFSLDVATTIIVKAGATGLTGAMTCPIGISSFEAPGGQQPIFIVPAGQALVLTQGATSQVSGYVLYSLQ